jgi:translation initiation factor 1
MARNRRERMAPDAPAPGDFGGLGTLLRASGLEASSAAHPQQPQAPPPPPTPPRAPGRVVLRREKKGRGGKVVTTLSHHGLDLAGTKSLAKRLRKALGCGAGVEGDAVVLQGDQRDRVAEMLEGEGWRVVRG